MNFESLTDWKADSDTLSFETGLTTQGTAALGIDGAGHTMVRSRVFSASAEVGTASDELTVDLFIPGAQPNPYWIGALQLYLTCPSHGLYDAYQGQVELTPLFVGEFNTVSFQLSQNALTALNDAGAWCSLGLALSVNDESGRYVLDNLAFR